MPISVGKPNKIYRGPVEKNSPHIKELVCAAAGFRPGQIITDVGSEFTLPAAASAAAVYVLNAPLHQNPLTYVYEAGETGFGYIPESGQHYLARLVAGTYASDAPLTTNGTGGLRLATADEPVVCHVWSKYGEPVVVPTGGDMADVRFK